MGTGAALRTTLLIGSNSDATAALTGIEVALSTMEPSGRLPSTVPASVSLGQSLSEADVASGAAFYLGDACLGALALEVAPQRAEIASAMRRAALRERLARATQWLAGTVALLQAADRAAPNRLLFDARAFVACGHLAGSPALVALATPFITQAMASVRPDGWFDEGGGWDTSYQAVGIDIGADVHRVALATVMRTALDAGLTRAAGWLANRVAADGRVDSGGNSRTCSGGESFLGEPKLLALPSVVSALIKSATSPDAMLTTAQREGARVAAQRVVAWATANPGANPCFELSSR